MSPCQPGRVHVDAVEQSLLKYLTMVTLYRIRRKLIESVVDVEVDRHGHHEDVVNDVQYGIDSRIKILSRYAVGYKT